MASNAQTAKLVAAKKTSELAIIAAAVGAAPLQRRARMPSRAGTHSAAATVRSTAQWSPGMNRLLTATAPAGAMGGRRLAGPHFAGGEQVRLEELEQMRRVEARADAVDAGGRGDAFRPAQPGERVRGMRRRLELVAEALERFGLKVDGKVRRQAASGRDLDVRDHVGGTPAGEVARDDLRRQRKARAHEFLRSHLRGERLAVDQNAVAIEDDHKGPPISAGCSACLQTRGESLKPHG